MTEIDSLRKEMGRSHKEDMRELEGRITDKMKDQFENQNELIKSMYKQFVLQSDFVAVKDVALGLRRAMISLVVGISIALVSAVISYVSGKL